MSAPDREDLLRHRGQLAELGLAEAEIDHRLAGIGAVLDDTPAEPAGQVYRRLAAEADSLGLSKALLADLYRLAATETRARAGGAGGALGGILAVVLGACAVATLLVVIMRLWVIPELQHITMLSGSDLPLLTRLVFDTAWFAPLLILLPLLAAGAVVWFYLKLASVYRLKALAPGWMNRLPGLAAALGRFRAGAAARLYRLLRAAGAGPGPALAAAGQAVGLTGTEVEVRCRTGLERAVGLGTEAAEIRHWESIGDGVGSGLMAAFVQRLVGYFLVVVTALMVGIVIIAVYLPIFGIGLFI